MHSISRYSRRRADVSPINSELTCDLQSNAVAADVAPWECRAWDREVWRSEGPTLGKEVCEPYIFDMSDDVRRVVAGV